MRRSRKKSIASTLIKDDARPPPPPAQTTRREQPPPEVMQQKKRHQDEVASLTTKNYRLAKELADLRLKHRDECKNVTRLTMENMNLASRCREAISHAAMLKKELAMQQKRTTQALAAQREQTKRMTDSLTSSFISMSSPESTNSRTQSSSKSDRASVCDEEDENVMRLVSSTPSPNRVGVHTRIENDFSNESKSSPKIEVQLSTSAKNASKMRLISGKERHEARSPSASNLLTSNSEGDDSIVGRSSLESSTISQSPEKEEKNNKKDSPLTSSVLYSTPKKSNRQQTNFFPTTAETSSSNATSERGLFPFSASPQVASKPRLSQPNKSYDEEFPSEKIETTDTKTQRKVNLMNSIDAFEQSFSTDFPDSFTPKEDNFRGSTLMSGQKIYDPFTSTPEKRLSEPCGFSTPGEEKKFDEPAVITDLEFRTPPTKSKTMRDSMRDQVSKSDDRPEKISSGSRPRHNIETAENEDLSLIDRTSNPTALSRRIQQKKLLDKNFERRSVGTTPEPSRNSIIDIVDTFEHPRSDSGEGIEHKTSTASRFQGPIRSLRKRNGKKPISYAEPALNTKLRRGDTFFPKTSVTMTEGDQNQAPNVVSPTPVVSP